MGPVEVCNIALAEAGSRVSINTFQDGTPQAVMAATFYTPKLQALARAAYWDSFRAQIALTQLKGAIINGVPSDNPPVQPFQVEYAWPSDCLAFRFLRPTVVTQAVNAQGLPLTSAPNAVLPFVASPTGMPFVVATDMDVTNNPIKVIYTNLYDAQGIYTRDLTQFPDLWDSMFLSGATALLASYFIASLNRDSAQMGQQISIAKGAIDAARSANANEGVSNIDHTPDWMRVRQASAAPWAYFQSGPGGVFPGGGWDSCALPNGEFY